MLLLVTGGAGSGKSAYARRLAESLAREAIAFTCPAWPPLDADLAGEGEPVLPLGDLRQLNDGAKAAWRRTFAWTQVPADEDCAQALNRVNLDSNPYRAERRALVLDSLSGWLRHLVSRDMSAGEDRGPQTGETGKLLSALLEFEGIVIVVTEEAAPGLVADPRERMYIRLLAEANRRLAAASHTIYRLSFGYAESIRGERL